MKPRMRHEIERLTDWGKLREENVRPITEIVRALSISYETNRGNCDAK